MIGIAVEVKKDSLQKNLFFAFMGLGGGGS